MCSIAAERVVEFMSPSPPHLVHCAVRSVMTTMLLTSWRPLRSCAPPSWRPCRSTARSSSRLSLRLKESASQKESSACRLIFYNQKLWVRWRTPTSLSPSASSWRRRGGCRPSRRPPTEREIERESWKPSDRGPNLTLLTKAKDQVSWINLNGKT